jgi:beta-galactosidase beta subunit
MVIGSIDTFDKGHVVYPEAITKALEYLRDHDFTKMEDGKYLIQGGRLFCEPAEVRDQTAGGLPS